MRSLDKDQVQIIKLLEVEIKAHASEEVMHDLGCAASMSGFFFGFVFFGFKKLHLEKTSASSGAFDYRDPCPKYANRQRRYQHLRLKAGISMLFGFKGQRPRNPGSNKLRTEDSRSEKRDSNPLDNARCRLATESSYAT